MSPFWLLIFAHIVSDFPLQTDKVYRIKKSYKWGVLLHVSICTIVNIIVLIPLLGYWQAWVTIAILFVVHALLDKSKIIITGKILSDGFLYFLADQIMHVFTIWLASSIIFNLGQLTQSNAFFPGFYNNPALIIIFSGLLLSVFGGAPVVYYSLLYNARKRTGSVSGQIQFPRFVERIPGYWERSVITLAMIFGGYYYILAFLAFIPALLAKNRNDDLKISMISSFAIGIIVGALTRVILFII